MILEILLFAVLATFIGVASFFVLWEIMDVTERIWAWWMGWLERLADGEWR